MVRASCGCFVEDGMVMHGFDGPCFDEPRGGGYEPTDEDYCHPHDYCGDDTDSTIGTYGRCYCGTREYPPGGAAWPHQVLGLSALWALATRVDEWWAARDQEERPCA